MSPAEENGVVIIASSPSDEDAMRKQKFKGYPTKFVLARVVGKLTQQTKYATTRPSPQSGKHQYCVGRDLIADVCSETNYFSSLSGDSVRSAECVGSVNSVKMKLYFCSGRPKKLLLKLFVRSRILVKILANILWISVIRFTTSVTTAHIVLAGFSIYFFLF
jgi:hypothetical protein